MLGDARDPRNRPRPPGRLQVRKRRHPHAHPARPRRRSSHAPVSLPRFLHSSWPPSLSATSTLALFKDGSGTSSSVVYRVENGGARPHRNLISHPDSPAEVDRAAATSIRCAGSISAPTGGRGGPPRRLERRRSLAGCRFERRLESHRVEPFLGTETGLPALGAPDF